MSQADGPLSAWEAQAWQQQAWQAANEKKRRNAFLSSANNEPWARWEYNPEEWTFFEEVDWRPIRNRFWLFVGLSILFIPNIAMLIWAGTYSIYPVLTTNIMLIFVFVFIFVVTAIYGHRYAEAKKRHQARQNEVHRITIAKRGIWEAGTYFPLDENDMVLNEVKMALEPPVLHVRRTKQFLGTETTPQPDTIRIPVPRGHEDEAASLVQRFRTEVIAAHMRSRFMSPPEPGI